MVGWGVYEQKVWSHLRDSDGPAIDEQTHFYLSGMAAVT